MGSATPPVQEVIHHGETGLLVDFFSPDLLAESVNTFLSDRSFARAVGQRARKLVLERYSLEECIPRQLALIRSVASGEISRNTY